MSRDSRWILRDVVQRSRRPRVVVLSCSESVERSRLQTFPTNVAKSLLLSERAQWLKSEVCLRRSWRDRSNGFANSIEFAIARKTHLQNQITRRGQIRTGRSSSGTGIVYSPSGGLKKEQFGTDTPIYDKLWYTSRGQLARSREQLHWTNRHQLESRADYQPLQYQLGYSLPVSLRTLGRLDADAPGLHRTANGLN